MEDKVVSVKDSAELREAARRVLKRHEAYLNGPVPADLLYGPADREPVEVLVDELVAIIAAQVAVAEQSLLEHLLKQKWSFGSNKDAWAVPARYLEAELSSRVHEQIKQLHLEADVWREAGNKGLPKGFQKKRRELEEKLAHLTTEQDKVS